MDSFAAIRYRGNVITEPSLWHYYSDFQALLTEPLPSNCHIRHNNILHYEVEEGTLSHTKEFCLEASDIGISCFHLCTHFLKITTHSQVEVVYCTYVAQEYSGRIYEH